MQRLQPEKPRRRQSLWRMVIVTTGPEYKAALASFSLKNYRAIDGILNNMYRTITKNTASFPTVLLYMKQFSATLQPFERRMLMANLDDEGDRRTWWTVCYHGRGDWVGWFCEWVGEQHWTILMKDHRCWADCLVEHLMEAGLFVMRHGEKMPWQDEPVHRFLQLASAESKSLWSCCVRVMDDVVGNTQAVST